MDSKRLFAEIRCLRLADGRDPFALYQSGDASKGWLIEQIVEAIVAMKEAGNG